MLRKVNGFLLTEPNVVFILEEVDLLGVIHNEQALDATFMLEIVFNALTIWFKYCEFATS